MSDRDRLAAKWVEENWGSPEEHPGSFASRAYLAGYSAGARHVLERAKKMERALMKIEKMAESDLPQQYSCGIAARKALAAWRGE